MIITPVEISTKDLEDRQAANSPNERSEGLHQSDIIKSICVELDPKRFDPSKPFDRVRLETGFAFERALEGGLIRRHPGLIRPGEVECDGVCGSPDGVITDTEPWRITEYKATWMSSGVSNAVCKAAYAGDATAIEQCVSAISQQKFWHWIVQMKGYCYMTNLPDAWLIAWFCMGDYNRAFGGPQMLSFYFHFSDRDLVENWSMLISHAKQKGML